MHCRRVQTPRGRWVSVPEERIAELDAAGRLSYGCCFACTRELFGLNPELQPDRRMDR